MEGPNGNDGVSGELRREGWGQWVRGQLPWAPSVSGGGRSDLRTLLGVMVAPLAPVHISASKLLPHLSIKDTPITRLDKYLSNDGPHDICSCQFAMHYSWSSEARAMRALANVSSLLRPGGAFVATMPNANVIIKRLREAEGMSFGNSVYWTSFDKEYSQKFDDALSQPEPMEDLWKLVDPTLGNDYPIESIHKMAQLAKACTQENLQLRSCMRSIIVALMTLSSSTEDWDMGSLNTENLIP